MVGDLWAPSTSRGHSWQPARLLLVCPRRTSKTQLCACGSVQPCREGTGFGRGRGAPVLWSVRAEFHFEGFHSSNQAQRSFYLKYKWVANLGSPSVQSSRVPHSKTPQSLSTCRSKLQMTTLAISTIQQQRNRKPKTSCHLEFSSNPFMNRKLNLKYNLQ